MKYTKHVLIDIYLIVVCNYPDLLRKISELYPYQKRSSQQTYCVSISMYVNKKGNQITHIPAYYQTECAEKKLLLTQKTFFMSRSSILFQKFGFVYYFYIKENCFNFTVSF